MFGEWVTFLTPGEDLDRYGDTVPDWSDPAETRVRAAVAPRPSSESTADGDKVFVGLTLYLRTTVTVTPKQRAMVRGDLYEVVGEPGVWRSPYTGWKAGTEVALQRVEG